MTRRAGFFIGFFILITSLQPLWGQIAVTGMVVDSVTLDPLPGTSIQLKKSKKGFTSREEGFFTIVSPGYDTLVFSRVGYKTTEYPLFGNERDILILMREETQTLKEVIVDVYPDEKPEHAAPREVRPLSTLEGIHSPFTYFSKEEKEKRMLVRFQKEQQKVQTYVDLITRPQFRHEIMNAFSITEEEYYDILIRFNTEKQSAHYLTNEEEIKKVILEFFAIATSN